MDAENLDEALHRGSRYLERRGIEDAQRNARLLLESATALGPAALVARLREPLAGPARRKYGRLLCARARRRPLQYLLGVWEFLEFELEVGPGALIPRPETEVLVERALERLPGQARRVVDVGTGTGCIAIAMGRARPSIHVVAVDRSQAALAIARRNLARHDLTSRVLLLRADLLEAIGARGGAGSVDAIVSNPPYVAEAEHGALMPEVRDHEPREALVPGPTGLEAYARILPAAARLLRPGGLVALEVGAGQEAAVAGMARASGLVAIEVHPDLAGIPRVVLARRS